jgi:para-aminobenzoate synthetase/4-amino-4-deoxychorismate lyase
LRITVAPDGEDRLVARSEMREAAPGAFVPLSGEEGPIAETSLHSLVLPGGLGAHKWTDRSLLEEAQARLRESALPLLVDEDGSVLEASRANLFAVRDDILLTPPLDGRVLPGVTRMRVLELAGEIGIEAREAELSRGDLLAADDVLLTGSVRGVERVDAVDGLPLRHGGQIAGRLTAELWQSWAGAKTAPLR